MKHKLQILLLLSCTLTASAQQAVDLGLSVAWADRNLGADSPEEAGLYLAWGELAQKKTYTLDNYRFGGGDFLSPTKYVLDTGEAWTTPDHKLFLDAEDDAATTMLGEGWRLPTYEELGELVEKCQWQWEEADGAKGYQVTGPNGNAIFLPMTGYYTGNTLFYTETEGYYWLNELDHYQTNFARTLRFTPRIIHHANFYEMPRDMGLAVRAIYAVK